MSIKVLLDTDIGSDIDDALCLAYLLAQPDCELLGVTTVTGEAEKRAMLASALCKAAGKRVPIFPGCEEPFLGAQQQPLVPQATALTRWEHDTSFPRGEAITFLRQTIRENPGQVILLGTGPLTNIALLFTLDKEIPSLLRGLVVMCGVFTNPLAEPPEWNAMLDPIATAIVYRAPVGMHRSIGLDVTRQVTMPAEEFRSRMGSRVLLPVLDFAEVWLEDHDVVTFHDPLAASTIFDDRICTFENGVVDIEPIGGELRGVTRWAPDRVNGRHEVVLQVDRDRFFEHYFSVVEHCG
jgi:purine nucleosidase